MNTIGISVISNRTHITLMAEDILYLSLSGRKTAIHITGDIGSSTLNSGMLPTMGSLLVYLKGLNPTGKKAAVFGTYGWAGGAQKDMEALLTAAGFELEPGFTCKWKAQPEDLEAARQLGYEFARKLQK